MNAIFSAFPAFLLVFCRITSFFVTAPIFSSRNIPTQFKIGLAFFVSLISFALVDAGPVELDGTFILMLLKEILVGLLLGFIAYMFFTVVQISGSFIDMQMGFSIANIIDPMTGTQAPVIGNLKFMMAFLLFLAYNGHHYLIRGIIDSYNWVPLSVEAMRTVTDGSVLDYLVKSFGTAFALAFQMAAPIVAALFLVDVGLGILSRAAPQFNMFVIGVPLKIIVGFMLMLIVIPSFAFLFSDVFQTMLESMHNLLVMLGAK